MLKLPYFLRNLQISLENNSKTLRIKNATFSGCFYINKNIDGNFQIYISVPLISSFILCIDTTWIRRFYNLTSLIRKLIGKSSEFRKKAPKNRSNHKNVHGGSSRDDCLFYYLYVSIFTY